MSTAAVSTLSIFQELQSFYQNRQADLKQLGNALQSGDLTGAQQAYQALAVLGEGGPFANSEPFSKSSRAQAFDALGEAIQAGDVARAQADFATLTGNHINPAQATPAAVVNLTGTQPSNASDSASSIYQQVQAYRQQRQADLAQLGQALQSGDLTGAQQAFDALTALGQSGPNKNGQTFQRADRTQDFQAIGQALQSGDLAGAQSAFASLAGTFGTQNQQAQSAISAYNGVTEIIINFLGPTTPIQPTGPPIFQAPPQEPPVSVGPPVGPPVFNPGPVGPPVSIAPPPIEPPVSQPPISTGSGAEIVINVGGASGNSTSGGSTTPELVINLGQGSGSSSASPEEVTINLGSGSAGAQVTIDTTHGTNGNSAEQVTINLNQTRNYELILNLFNATALSQAQSSSNALSVSA